MTNEDRYTWDLSTIFADTRAWHAGIAEARESAEALAGFRGRILSDAETLLAFLEQREALTILEQRIRTFAYLTHSCDMSGDEANSMVQIGAALEAQLAAQLSFVEPEILAAPPGRVEQLLGQSGALERYRHYLTEIERHRPHTLSPAEEAVIGQLSLMLRAPESIRDAIHDSDMRFRRIAGPHGPAELGHGTIDEHLQSSDRTVRQAAFESYTDAYLGHAHSLAATLTWEATAGIQEARLRRHPSVFRHRLFSESLPEGVYAAAMGSCYEHYPLFHRYFRAKARILGVARLAEHDIFAPLSPKAQPIPYERAVPLVLDSLQPLGHEYVDVARRGLEVERWADVYPRPGKFSNAFSAGCYGSRPFFLLNYAPTMPEVGTLAHELGHSMHSYLTEQAQSVLYSSYAMTVAETASNLNQVLLRAHVLKTADRDTALAVLDEAFYFAHRYLFMMPTLSRVERLLHGRYARGKAVSLSQLKGATVAAFAVAYGDTVEFDPERLGMKWAQFTHLYSPFYMFQYAVGISAAMAIGAQIIAGDTGVRDRYLNFLSLGASRAPTEIFLSVGIDVGSPETYRRAFEVVGGYVKTLEELA